MQLFIKNVEGKEINLHPVMSTKKDLAEEVGETFTLGKSDIKYHVDEIYAKPDADTSFWFSLIAATIGIVCSLNFIVAISLFVVFYIISKTYFSYDKKAVEKFNASKSYD